MLRSGVPGEVSAFADPAGSALLSAKGLQVPFSKCAIRWNANKAFSADLCHPKTHVQYSVDLLQAQGQIRWIGVPQYIIQA